MACFGNINVSQGTVATYARCGVIFNIHLTAYYQEIFQWIFFKSAKIWQKYGHEPVARFFRPTLYNHSSINPTIW